MNGLPSLLKTFRGISVHAAVISCELWLPITRTGGPSRTSSGPTNRIDRCSDSAASKSLENPRESSHRLQAYEFLNTQGASFQMEASQVVDSRTSTFTIRRS